MTKGYLAIVLHAHLPFVRYAKEENRLEERWLFEAITETYVPLLQVFSRLIRDNIHFRITMSLTPTLVAMLTDPLLQSRYTSYLTNLIGLAKREKERTKNDANRNLLAGFYLQHFEEIYQFYIDCEGDLVGLFRSLQDGGYLDIMTSSATHAFLPLILTEEALRAQISIGVQSYTRHFGRKPSGIWLPECGYRRGVDRILSDYELDYFVGAPELVVDKTTEQFVPSVVSSSANVAAFIRDTDSAAQVWSSISGYPGDAVYREFYQDIGYELSEQELWPFVMPGGIPVDTGIKYFRITGKNVHKQLYSPKEAMEKAKEHAADFLRKRMEHIMNAADNTPHPPIIVAPYDAELFGHWWYEGPIFIEQVLREIDSMHTLKTITLREFARTYSPFPQHDMVMSSWGRDGYADVWLNETNDWVTRKLHSAEQLFAGISNQFRNPALIERVALNQAARELLLAQSSDFPFMLDGNSMVQFADVRLHTHISRFHELVNMLQTSSINETRLAEIVEEDCIFSELAYETFQTEPTSLLLNTRPLKVLMLAWEFPPRIIGGLSRHVYALSTRMAQLGIEVYVITAATKGSPRYEQFNGLHVYRAEVLNPHGNEFINWVLQLNLGMMRICQDLYMQGLRFDIVHAHDWLVYTSAQMAKSLFVSPLVATIHATECGRNRGIHTSLQAKIHHTESDLVKLAEKVVVCSSYMKDEVCSLFEKNSQDVMVIPNGIDSRTSEIKKNGIKNLAGSAHQKNIVFIGRLVREKGVHILLDAATQIVEKEPTTQFIIAGDGPIRNELVNQVAGSNLDGHVQFVGFVRDREKAALLDMADVAVFPSLYEPFGIVVLEAMAAKVPVVTTGIGGLADIVSNMQTGIVVSANNSSSLAQGILQVLQTPKLGEQIAKEAFAMLWRYDWLDIAKRTVEIYSDVLSMRGNRLLVNDQNSKIRYTIET